MAEIAIRQDKLLANKSSCTVIYSQILMSVPMIMEDVTRPVPTLLGATSAVVRVDIPSIRMRGAVIVS